MGEVRGNRRYWMSKLLDEVRECQVGRTAGADLAERRKMGIFRGYFAGPYSSNQCVYFEPLASNYQMNVPISGEAEITGADCGRGL